MPTSDSFGRWLKRRRKARDLTQAELARLSGCAAITLRKIEAGELRPSRELGARLVALLADSPAEADSALRAARHPLADDGAGTTGAVRAPSSLSSPVGREGDLASLCALAQGGARLITLIGPGGVGKTRLALAVAERLADDCPDGVMLPKELVADALDVAHQRKQESSVMRCGGY